MELEEIRKRREDMNGVERAAYDLGIETVERELAMLTETAERMDKRGEIVGAKILARIVLHLQRFCKDQKLPEARHRLFMKASTVLSGFFDQGMDSPSMLLYLKYTDALRARAQEHPEWTAVQLAEPVLDQLAAEVDGRPELSDLLSTLRSLVPRD